MRYVFHPAAEAEHLKEVGYYESKRPGLGAEYLRDFEKAMYLVSEGPHRYPKETESDLRRIRLTKFPFTVFYRESRGIVQVLAIAHHRRPPGYWTERL